MKRIENSAEIILDAPVLRVFPLFDPVNEMKWVNGWAPKFIYPTDASVEEQMIFITPARFPHEGDYHWVLTKFLPDLFQIEYVVSTRERIWSIRVRCFPVEKSTRAKISYQFTALTDEGAARNEQAIGMMFQHNLADWEDAINYYLRTGRKKDQD
jgi:hypothetical protein